LEASLNFDGETSPYLQYTHARCCSILNKSEGLEKIDDIEYINNGDSFELIKHINDFDRIVLQSAEDFEPCYISRYLMTLGSLFNKFYNNHRIIDNDKVSSNRLKLVELTKNRLAKGLKLLGIDAPSAM